MTAPLVTRWPAHSEAEIAAVAEVLRSGRTNYWTGEHGQAFETEWARHVGVPHALTVSNGTTALEAALRGVGMEPAPGGSTRDEVIVPCRTFMATASAVVHTGGRPVLADIDPGTLCVTEDTLEAVRTGATVGVIVVHYAGLPCPDMDNIVRWAMRHGLWVIEDCAHAHGADVGRRSHVAAWSFCVGKIMSTGGEGGMVACSDERVAARMRAYRDHGRYQLTGRRDMSGAGASGYTEFVYSIEEFGSNLRMTEMQAVLGRYQLRGLVQQSARRRWIAGEYDKALGARSRLTPEQRDGHARYLYHVETRTGRERDGAMVRLKALGIPVGIGGCANIGREPAFTKRGWEWECPEADGVGARTFSVPVYPTLADAEVERVCVALKEVLG